MYDLNTFDAYWKAAGNPQSGYANGAGPGFIAGPAWTVPMGITYGLGPLNPTGAPGVGSYVNGGPMDPGEEFRKRMRALGLRDVASDQDSQGQGDSQGQDSQGQGDSQDQDELKPQPRKRIQGYKSPSARQGGVGGQLSNRNNYMPVRSQPPARRWT